MNRFLARVLPVLAFAAGCGDGSGPGGTVDCDEVPPTNLSPGRLALVDASETACLRLEAAGAAGAEYLYVAYSAAAGETREGTSAAYQLTGTAVAPPPAAVARPVPRARLAPAGPAREFHVRLRVLGQELARKHRSAGRSGPTPALRALPPVLGESRTFNVLRSASVTGQDPDDYVQVEGTARYVGLHVAIFLDDASPVQGGYTQFDLDAIGDLFDDHLHPIGVDAFGSETDINGDGLVLVLLTDRVTRLADCGPGQTVVGLFFGVDLLEDLPGSNHAEIFYGLTPDEQCGIDRARALELLPPVFIHEFQHMINYGQKVIVRDGDQGEDVWLDEGLSSLAEELGGRLVPDDRCVDNDCLTQFNGPNLVNAYNYLAGISDAYLIGPRQPPLDLTQYGATWLFLRWLADHFAAEPTLGTDLTRALVQTSRTGADNVASATDTPFDRILGEWQLANYLEDHPDFADLTTGSRFEYTSWNLREVFATFHQQLPPLFPVAYPLEPDSFTGPDYVRGGVLHAGSGQHLLLGQVAETGAVDLRLTDPDGAEALSPEVDPRTIILRLR